MKFPKQHLLLFLCFSFPSMLLQAAEDNSKQSSSIRPALSNIPSQTGWTLVGRKAVTLPPGDREGVRLFGDGKYGFARLEGVDFSDGTIEFDVRGKDIPQGSFVGFAFHGADDKTYDAVYFRPFNFKATDPLRRAHAVQYVSHPDFTWKKLRETKPEQFEKPVVPAPDPQNWFHVRIIVRWPSVSVYVNDAKTASLQVAMLSSRKHGWLGLWTDVSDGDYANLVITPGLTTEP